MSEKIKDFGEKIGGARKDVWRAEGMSVDDILGLTDEEKDYYINRDMVWPVPRSKELVEAGLDVLVAFWQREVRKKVRKYPLISVTDNKTEIQEGYVRMVGKIRDRVMKIKSVDEFADFYNEVKEGFGDYELFIHCACRYDMYNLKYNLPYIRNRCMNQNFPYGRKAASKTIRKKAFPMPLLDHIKREGPDVRRGRRINADIWQREFSFRGVEFGNWLSQKDRQDSMNYCYEALCDLADAMMVEKTDIAFDGQLALAFGARGRSGAASHYEYMRKVINLTKMHGAGTLAHEWAYALDHALAKFYGVDDTSLLQIHKETLSYAIGREDCTGKTVFIGDIVEYDYMKNPYVIEFDTETYAIIARDPQTGDVQPLGNTVRPALRVIGNIYQNPEKAGLACSK